MAGAILIDKNNGISINSFGFSLITEETREELCKINKELLFHIYSSIDEECMAFIRLYDLNYNDLNQFYMATKAAYKNWSEKNGEKLPIWEEMLNKIEERLNVLMDENKY